MAGEKLHKFDLQLCDYVLGNTGQYLDEKKFRRAAKKLLDRPLVKYLEDESDPDAEHQPVLLSEAEFNGLDQMFDWDTPELHREWLPNESLHRRRVQCVGEIRKELTKQDAEDWSSDCAAFAKRLEGRKVYLDEGIQIVREWVDKLRQLLRAMGATDLLPYPEGRFPTLTNPVPPPAEPPAAPPSTRKSVTQEEPLEEVRKLIKQMGTDAPVKNLLSRCNMREKTLRDCLRTLESRGEYKGFSRKRPRCYPDISPSQE